MRGFGEVLRPQLEEWKYENEVNKEVVRAEAALLKIMEWSRGDGYFSDRIRERYRVPN